MLTKTLICKPDEISIKPALRNPGFITTHKQNRTALGIESEGDSPDTIGDLKP